jgi:hypothetical protein
MGHAVVLGEVPLTTDAKLSQSGPPEGRGWHLGDHLEPPHDRRTGHPGELPTRLGQIGSLKLRDAAVYAGSAGAHAACARCWRCGSRMRSARRVLTEIRIRVAAHPFTTCPSSYPHCP